MLGRAVGAVLAGLEARLVHVEVDLGGGLPTLAAVGLPDVAVREGLDRIRAALPHVGLRLPQRRIIVNLAPADVRKHGASLDLPMAIAVLEADGQIQPLPAGTVAVGELGLDGSLRPVRGALSMALAAREAGHGALIVPSANADEAALVDGLRVHAASTLADVVALARGDGGAAAAPTDVAGALARFDAAEARAPDLADVRGQAGARRALEIAAAGGHHILLVGPPGSGKSMLARRLPGILPPLVFAEALEVTRIWSVAGLARGLVTARPFRAPHSGVTVAALTGGGAALRPGEMSLATHGVLFLDEFPEFRREALEALRAPLEDGFIVVTRARGSAAFPARFALVAAMNPCACGFFSTPAGRCRCTPNEVRRYWAKLSGPLLDRFDLVVDVPAVDLPDLIQGTPGEPSAVVRTRVLQARARQVERWDAGDARASGCNARMLPAELDRFAELSSACRRLLEHASRRLGLSARGFDRVRRIARTLADLDGTERIAESHLAEAVQHRRLPGPERLRAP